MELKVKTPTFPEVIEFNFEELKNEITERASAYANLVYTNDQIQDAKKDRATLNKFVKALSDERIKIKKECLKPYEDFEKKIKELDGIVNKAIRNIDNQVKAYDEQKKAEKMEQIQEYWNRVTCPDHPLTLQCVMNPKWLNATVSMKAIQEEINGILAKYASDISTLQNLPEFSFHAIEMYKTTLDLGKALNEAHRLSDMAKRKAEEERIEAERKAEQERKKAEAEEAMKEALCKMAEAAKPAGMAIAESEKAFAKCMNPPVEEKREWISFSALLTTDDALALKAFFESRNIEFVAV